MQAASALHHLHGCSMHPATHLLTVQVITNACMGAYCTLCTVSTWVASWATYCRATAKRLCGVCLQEEERLVFSHRRASSDADMQNFNVGDVVVGVVQSVKVYGAFLDIGGGTMGLLHISQITHERLTTVEQVLQVGDKLKVMILSMDRDRGRVTLSTKKLEPTPGDMLRDPQLVFEKAEEMASAFVKRIANADAGYIDQDPDVMAAQQGFAVNPGLAAQPQGPAAEQQQYAFDT
eukprot:GHRR01015776.1.p2 GENE.GHRR01015776.1~~GHRR01015776.1.p2  ORF type:complete len:235 (+),score=92.81 GHRR01015776.1:1082-1786(+)